MRKNPTTSAQLLLPPAFRLVTLRELGDAFAHAMAIAGVEGAGTLVRVGRFDVVEFAVVLEPEEPLQRARCAFYAGMVALHSALLVHAPPERPITFAWPDAIHVDRGLAGGGRLGWPDGSPEDEPPAWLVFGASVRVAALSAKEPGLRAHAVTLEEEGFDDPGNLLESFARHFMMTMDAWQSGEFGSVIAAYLEHLALEKGAIPSLDKNGDLLVRWRGQAAPDRHSLTEALAAPSWLDPETGGPPT